MNKKLSELLCRHHYIIKRNCNVYEKSHFGWSTLYRCTKCGKEKFSYDYEKAGHIIEL